jgi:PPK2 family polyphosphate:nucleotide phosphotransferase
MHCHIDISQFRVQGDQPKALTEFPHQIDDLYEGKDDYRELLEEFQEEIDDLQRMMYAHDRYSLLLVFQAMDAAGKDGTIRHIMSGVNAHGVEVHAFKQPSTEELQHDYLWRTTKRLPQRGHIGIFNRSYYEEVLVVRVHPEILTQGQHIPAEMTMDTERVWAQRYRSMRDLERHLYENGTQVIKFFLHLSPKEQAKRFLDRIEEPDKNWKFSEGDLRERKYWDQYMAAYEKAINATAAPHAPWYVVPADDKKNMRLIVSQVILEHLRKLDMQYPEVSDARRAELDVFRDQLKAEIEQSS